MALFWHIIIYVIPLWVWLPVAVVIVGTVHRLFGIRNAVSAAIALGALLMLSNTRQAGWDDREKKGKEDVRKAADIADNARAAADAYNADPDRLRDDDGYRRN